jgi:hypothetical protein
VGQTDEGLNDETGEGSSDEDEGHQRFREAEGDEVGRSYKIFLSHNARVGYRFAHRRPFRWTTAPAHLQTHL